MYNAYIYDGLRTPFGRHAGSLSSVRADDLLAGLLKAVMARNASAGPLLEDIIVGATNQAGEDCRNVARMSGLLAGLPIGVGGQTVNRLCGSSLAAVLDSARAIHCGDGDFYLAAGVESMSRAPFVLAKAESAFSRNGALFDTSIGARFPNPVLLASVGDDTMPQTANNVAREWGITREQCDRFAASSQAKYQSASETGFFDQEMMAVELSQGRRKPPVSVAHDEHPRADSTFAVLEKLKPLFPDGVVTAGNASGINDGAAALLLGSREAGERLEMSPRGRVIAGAIAGVEPRIMGIGPVEAIKKVCARTGLSLAEMDVIEINEAFAAQALGCMKLLGIAEDDNRVNPNGGAIAVGHPLGASGARIALTALRQLERCQGRYAVVSMCIGMGQGIALIIERV